MGIYGDGSAGAVTVDGSGVFPFDNPQFTSLSIASGESLHLVSGTIIRCTGDFTNNGTLNINVIACGGYTGDANVTADTLTYPYQPPHPGWSIRFPTAGEVAINAAGAAGGLGGTGLTVPEQARWLLHPGIFGGGGGANSSGGAGGYGGGALVILVRGTFTNNGTILARGDAGSGNSGAGAGGVIIIAARHAIDNSGGTIAARGADARDVTGAIGEALGGGGGGGGGIVHLLAPTIDAGTIDVAGGLGGAANPNPVAATKHVGGGGGGACGGNGGYGGGVPLGSPVVPESGTDGGIGQIILDEFDPTYVF